MAFIDGAPQTVGDLEALLVEAISGSLGPADVKQRWSVVPKDDVLRGLRDAVLFAVEHVPYERDGSVGGSRWRGSVDHDDLHCCLRQIRQLDSGDPATPLPSMLDWP